jgi:chromosomal replication initiation ATPase DnaA
MTAGRGRQLALDLPHRVSLSREDFLVAPSNANAVALIDSWPHWPQYVAIIVGPPGSGKSHLAEVWREKSGANTIQARDLRVEKVPALVSNKALAVEDAGAGAIDERALFHLFNFVREHQAHLLITANSHPTQWGIKLPDLISRLQAMPTVELGLPDDTLLRGVIVKLFADHQIAIDETVVAYLLARMPRSLEAARKIVAIIDRKAFEEKAEVTRPFVSRLLAEFAEPGFFDDSAGS